MNNNEIQLLGKAVSALRDLATFAPMTFLAKEELQSIASGLTEIETARKSPSELQQDYDALYAKGLGAMAEITRLEVQLAKFTWITDKYKKPELIHGEAPGSFHSDYVLVIDGDRKTVAAYAVDDYGPHWIEGGPEANHLSGVSAWMELP